MFMTPETELLQQINAEPDSGIPAQHEARAGSGDDFWLWCWIFSSFAQPYQDYALTRTLRPMHYYREVKETGAAFRMVISDLKRKLRRLRGEFVAKKSVTPVHRIRASRRLLRPSLRPAQVIRGLPDSPPLH